MAPGVRAGVQFVERRCARATHCSRAVHRPRSSGPSGRPGLVRMPGPRGGIVSSRKNAGRLHARKLLALPLVAGLLLVGLVVGGAFAAGTASVTFAGGAGT